MRKRSLPIAVILASLTAPAAVHAQRLKPPDKLHKLEARAVADSNDASTHLDLAFGYWSEGRYDDAEASIKLAIQIDPQFAEAYLALAQLPYARRPELWREISEGRVPERWLSTLEGADRHYRLAFLLDPLVDLEIIAAVIPPRSIDPEADSPQPAPDEIVVRAFDDMAAGRYNRAHEKLERRFDDLGFEQDPDAAPDWLLWYHALTAARQEKHEDAIRDLDLLRGRSLDDARNEGLLRVPLQAADFRYLIATLKLQAGLAVEAVQIYQEVLEDDPDYYLAYVQIARIHESRSDWREAAEACRNAVRANPDDPSLLYDLGVMLGRANRLGEAEEALLRARTLNPRDARIPYVLGLVRISRGNADGAREALDHFVSIAPSRYKRMITDAKQRLTLLR